MVGGDSQRDENFDNFLNSMRVTRKTLPPDMTWSSARCYLRSHFPVCMKNNLFIVGIGPMIKKELELIFRSDISDRTCVYS